MKISAAQVKELRDETGSGVLEAKNALEDADGDFEKAVIALRAKGAAKASKKTEREATEGVVEVYGHPGNRVGVILELNSETDFVARNEEFLVLAHDLALHIAAMEPLFVAPDDVPQAVLDAKREEWRAQALAEGKSPEIAERIVEGRVKKFYEDKCLLEQTFVKDDNVKVKDLVSEAVRTFGENVVVRRFARYQLGDEL
jgi:elongation factor Ts